MSQGNGDRSLEQILLGATQLPQGRDGSGQAPLGAGRGSVTDPGVLPRIEANIPALRRYATALLRNRDEADDLVHDCLVRALDKLHTRREEADVRAWLFTIMHNLFISQMRRRRSRPTPEPLDESHESAVGLRPVQEDALQWRDLQRGLQMLPEEQRSVILLVSVEDLSYAEAAQVLGVPVGTVMSRLARGRERLRQHTGQDARAPLRRAK
jgi:RNA polymerase sigma factor (sigma-70 family)